MVAGKRYVPRKGAKARRRFYKKKGRRGVVRSWASEKQTIALADDPVNTIFRIDDINLSQFDRLSHIARAYQYYRITKVEMKFKPLVDSFFANANSGSVPYLYYLIQKTDNLAVASNDFNSMRDSGAKPIRMDDKTRTVSWRPGVAVATMTTEGTSPSNPLFAQQKISPWLSTNFNANTPGGTLTWLPSAIPHQGLLYGVEQNYISGSGDGVFYTTDITIHVQFKKPLNFNNDPGAVPCAKKELVAQ